jgi:carboxyl-terminal processing protease
MDARIERQNQISARIVRRKRGREEHGAIASQDAVFDLVQGQCELERTELDLVGAAIKKTWELEHRILNLRPECRLQGQGVVQVDPEGPRLELILRNLKACRLEIGFIVGCANLCQPGFTRDDPCRIRVQNLALWTGQQRPDQQQIRFEILEHEKTHLLPNDLTGHRTCVQHRFRTALLFTVLLTSLAFSSPASDLTSQFQRYLSRYYVEPAKLDLTAIRTQLERALKTNCTDNDCAAQKLHETLRSITREFPDGVSSFRTPEEVARLQLEQGGDASQDTRYDLGWEVRRDSKNRDVVVRLLEGGPAALAGVQVGDVIENVSHGSKAGALRDVPFTNSSAAGLNILRRDQRLNLYVTPITGTITTMLQPSAKLLTVRNAKVLYLRVPSFRSIGTAQRLHDAISKFSSQNPAALVLDLRYNSGGFLDEAMLFLSALTEGDVLQLKSRQATQTYAVQDGTLEVDAPDSNSGTARTVTLDRYTRFDGPTFALVNASTSSSAEILVALLAHDHIARVIGEPTRGLAAYAVLPLRLSDGSELRLASVRNHFPDDEPFTKNLIPDRPVPDDLNALTEGRDVMLEEVMTELEATLQPTGARH